MKQKQKQVAPINPNGKEIHLRRIYVEGASTYIKFRNAILHEGIAPSLTPFPAVTWPLKIAAIQATTHSPQSYPFDWMDCVCEGNKCKMNHAESHEKSRDALT